jgi:hypothetical protein
MDSAFAFVVGESAVESKPELIYLTTELAVSLVGFFVCLFVFEVFYVLVCAMTLEARFFFVVCVCVCHID